MRTAAAQNKTAPVETFLSIFKLNLNFKSIAAFDGRTIVIRLVHSSGTQTSVDNDRKTCIHNAPVLDSGV